MNKNKKDGKVWVVSDDDALMQQLLYKSRPQSELTTNDLWTRPIHTTPKKDVRDAQDTQEPTLVSRNATNESVMCLF